MKNIVKCSVTITATLILTLSLYSCKNSDSSISNIKTSSWILNNHSWVNNQDKLLSASWNTIKNSLLNNKYYTKFLKLSNKDITLYDCSKFKTSSWTKINLEKACNSKKTNIKLQNLNKDSLLNFDCDKEYKGNNIICKRLKIYNYFDLKEINNKTENCNIFKLAWEKLICEELMKARKERLKKLEI